MNISNRLGETEDWRGRLLGRTFDFAALVKHELKRSERYCSFMSLMTLRFDDLNSRLRRKFPADESLVEAYWNRLVDSIRSQIRSTDVVSSYSRDSVGLLLVETPSDGAEALGERLKDYLEEFFQVNGGAMSGVEVDLEIGCYPESPDSIRLMLSDFSN